MKQLIQMILEKKKERDLYINQLDKRTHDALNIIDEVYSERRENLKKKEAIISSLLENGDTEALIAKITEAKDLISQPVDEEIKNRLSDCKLKKCN